MVNVFGWSVVAGMTLIIAAITETTFYLCENKRQIRRWALRIARNVTDAIYGLLIDTDEEEHMPKEYVSWASAEKWRQTRIRPQDWMM